VNEFGEQRFVDRPRGRVLSVRKIVRRWRAKWAARVNAGTDWPRFRLKIEGDEVRPA
jgi:hypothetical protein